MKTVTRRLLALLLALCLCASLAPAAFAHEAQPVQIEVDTTILEVEDSAYTYECLYQATLSLNDDMIDIIWRLAQDEDKWAELKDLCFTCTLSDDLTKCLENETIPAYDVNVPKISYRDETGNVDCPFFVSAKSPYVEDGSLKLVYKVNDAPEMETAFEKFRASESAFRSFFKRQMSMYTAFMPFSCETKIPSVTTTATVTLTYDDGSPRPTTYLSGSAVLAEGETTTETSRYTPPAKTGVATKMDIDGHDPFFQGYPDGTFQPEGSITRAEVAVALYRRLSEEPQAATKATKRAGVTFTDVDPDSWYAEAVYALTSKGYLKGVGDGKFAPNQPISRGDFALLLSRFANPADLSQVSFSDVPSDSYAYDGIMTAAAYGWVNGVGNGKFAPDRNITRAEAAKMLCLFLGRIGDKAAAQNGYGRSFSDVSDSHWANRYIAEATTVHTCEKIGNLECWVIE